MSALYRVVSFPIPLHSCKPVRRIILCAASSGGMTGSSASWRSLVSEPDASECNRFQAQKGMRKRLQVAGVDQEELLDPWLLADPDSRFAELHGVQIHYKVADSSDGREEQSKGDGFLKNDDVSHIQSSSSASACSSRPLKAPSLPSSSSSSETAPLPSSTPAILLHGFGASLFSWERVLKPLAKALQSRVLAFDRPAFGLTSRIKIPLTKSSTSNGDLMPLINPYSVAFSSTACIAFIDLLQASKAILIGHSAGCIIAADAYLKAPERVAALILVAPALFAPILANKKPPSRQEESVPSKALAYLWAKITWMLSKLGELLKMVLSALGHIWYRTWTAFLRSEFSHWLVRIVMDKLSLQAVRLAWYDKNKIDEYVIAGYTKPLRCRDWERALLEYVIALAGDPSINEGQAPISQRLSEIECPVLVISGDSDALVPAWNAERLSKVLPNARYHVIRNCGHLPQEETPEEFLSVIQEFVRSIEQGGSGEQALDESMVCMPA